MVTHEVDIPLAYDMIPMTKKAGVPQAKKILSTLKRFRDEISEVSALPDSITGSTTDADSQSQDGTAAGKAASCPVQALSKIFCSGLLRFLKSFSLNFTFRGLFSRQVFFAQRINGSLDVVHELSTKMLLTYDPPLLQKSQTF